MTPTIEAAWLEDIFEQWAPLLDLPGIHVEQSFLDCTRDDDETTAADTQVKWAYRWAQIRWYLPVIAGMTRGDLEETAVHEYAHVLLGVLNDRFKAGSDEYAEHATENVCRALLAVRKART